jgi:hypothetical protein
LSTVVDALAVCGVDDPDECICFLEVVLPVCSQRLLASYVPCYQSVCAEAPCRCSFAHMFSLYLHLSASLLCEKKVDVPIVFDSLDDEAKCRADAVHIFVHDLLYDCCLACVVQTPSMQSAFAFARHTEGQTYNIRIRISLSFSRAFRNIDSIMFRLKRL